MLKTVACLLVFAVLVASFGFMHAAAGQDESCVPEFAIYSAESIDGAPATFVIIRIAVKNTGSCAGTATVSAQAPEDWLAPPFTTDVIEPGDTDTTHSIKVIMPSDAITSMVNFTAPGANGSSTRIIIAGSPEETENATQEQPSQQNQTPNLIIDTTPAPIAPAAQPTQPAQPSQAEQPAVQTTGLLTANPSAQIAVFAVLLFGAGYMAARIKGEGFRYRFKRK